MILRAAKICASYPILEESGAIEQILPKKEQAILAKLYAPNADLCPACWALNVPKYAIPNVYRAVELHMQA